MNSQYFVGIWYYATPLITIMVQLDLTQPTAPNNQCLIQRGPTKPTVFAHIISVLGECHEWRLNFTTTMAWRICLECYCAAEDGVSEFAGSG